MNLTTLLQHIESATTLAELETAYEASLGKKWRLNEQFAQLKTISSAEEKKALGQEIATAKESLTTAYDLQHKKLNDAAINASLASDPLDISAPSPAKHHGSYSLLNSTRRRIEDICQSMGFHIHYGHDMVSKFANFISLNIPLTHPATEMHDTFFIDEKDDTGENFVLRTHTTAMDNELIKHYADNLTQNKPIKFILPSKVYRYEATDASHDTTFYQLDGVYIDEGISIAHFKDFIQKLMSAILETEVKVRMRPGYFPFVEPGYEIDASCPICQWEGCSLCKKTGWIELMGAGMLHPEVLRHAGIDATKYSGYAFGMGINRLVAVKYRIKDIRLFTNGDMRFGRSFAHIR